MEHLAVSPWVSLAYLIAGVCFILALRGLSSPATSQSGNRYGMIGMALAVGTTLISHFPHLSSGLIDPSGCPADADICVTSERIAVDWVAAGQIFAAIAVGAAIGLTTARRIKMTDMPQLVAAFHSLVGLAAVLVGWAAFLNPQAFGIVGMQLLPTPGHYAHAFSEIRVESRFEMGLGVAIGAITFSGSIIAFLKLNGNMSGKPILLPARHVLNLGTLLLIIGLVMYFSSIRFDLLHFFHGSGFLASSAADGVAHAVSAQQHLTLIFFAITILSFIIGFLLIIPIGGADMPVVVSMLNSYSGWAAAAMGFTLQNSAMIITGALVGSSGAILSYIMCKAMNRSFISVIAGGFGAVASAGGDAKEQRPWKRGSADDAAYMMKQADSVIIVPGYGMAVAQAQHALREMADVLKKDGVTVKYAIHPVAGRMPGHMNVLLAEANVPYDEVFELEDINSEFAQTDVAFIIGANDVVNPAAKTDKSSPIYGMPVFDVEKAKTVFFIKRSMGGVGYAGVDNDVFYADNTMMLLADAKKMCEDIVKALAH